MINVHQNLHRTRSIAKYPSKSMLDIDDVLMRFDATREDFDAMLRCMRFLDCKSTPFEYISFNHLLTRESPCAQR